MSTQRPPIPYGTLPLTMEERWKACGTGDPTLAFQYEATLSTVRADLEWRVRTLETALQNWGHHFTWCHQFTAWPENGVARPSCNCGFDDALKGNL